MVEVNPDSIGNDLLTLYQELVEVNHACSVTGGTLITSFIVKVVEVNGFEPMTSCVQGRRSPS